jgi:hypothetical protein
MNALSRLALGLLMAFVCVSAARADDSNRESLLVCKTLHAKQSADQIKTEVKAVTFTAPNGDGRRGAVGLLVPTKGKPGTRITFKFHRSPTGYGFQVIHPLKEGHVLANVSSTAVTLYRGGSWTNIGWGNPATGEKVTATKKAGEVLPIQPDKEYDVISELSSSGRYRLWINGTLMCDHQVKEARPLVLEMKDGPIYGGSEAPTLYGSFQGPAFESKLKSGQAGVIVGPMDGSGPQQRMDQITIIAGA